MEDTPGSFGRISNLLKWQTWEVPGWTTERKQLWWRCLICGSIQNILFSLFGCDLKFFWMESVVLLFIMCILSLNYEHVMLQIILCFTEMQSNTAHIPRFKFIIALAFWYSCTLEARSSTRTSCKQEQQCFHTYFFTATRRRSSILQRHGTE